MTLETRPTDVRIFSLEMTTPTQLRPAAATDLRIARLTKPDPVFLQYLWLSVGGPWSWGDRLSWTPEQWSELASDAHTFTWAAYVGGNPAGFFELHRSNNETEITFFGLLRDFFGRGYGGHLLTEAVTQAWRLAVTRVWVHTATTDGPHALANYEARGFQRFDEKSETWDVAQPYRTKLDAWPEDATS